MTDATELLPCPFCGGEAEWKSGGPGCAFITCKSCPAETGDGSIPRIRVAWNTRADLHQQALDAAREEGRKQGLEEAMRVAAKMDGEWFQNTYQSSYNKKRYTADAVERMLMKPLHILSEDIAEAIRALIDRPGDPVAEADSFDALICDAKEEAERAMQKFPQPNYVISKVAEEAGEVVKAAIHCAEGREEASEVRGEMKQLVAMLYRLWVEGDGVHGLRALAEQEDGQ